MLDLQPDLETWLVEDFVNEEAPGDGELFCKIRQYGSDQRSSLEAKWRARLKGGRKANLTGLIHHDGMTKAFDALRPIPGLWDGMMLTKLHKMMALHAHEAWCPPPRLLSANFYVGRSVFATSATSSRSGWIWSTVMSGR